MYIYKHILRHFLFQFGKKTINIYIALINNKAKKIQILCIKFDMYLNNLK